MIKKNLEVERKKRKEAELEKRYMEEKKEQKTSRNLIVWKMFSLEMFEKREKNWSKDSRILKKRHNGIDAKLKKEVKKLKTESEEIKVIEPLWQTCLNPLYVERH